jgi:hypothetical protein
MYGTGRLCVLREQHDARWLQQTHPTKRQVALIGSVWPGAF